MFNPGEVVVASVKLPGSDVSTTRAVVVLFEDFGNVVVAGITSNPYFRGIPLTKREGALRDSIIKLNNVFTVDSDTLSRPLFRLSKEKKKLLFENLVKLLSGLEA